MSQRRRRLMSRFQVAIIALVVVILATATLFSRFYFERRRFEMPAGLPSLLPHVRPAGPAQFRVSTLDGNVEAFQNGQWWVARAGHLLSPQDVVRTHDDSTASLSRGNVEIKLGRNMDLRVDELGKGKTKVGLLRGTISANVGKDNEKLEIEARGTRTTNVGAARFTVSAPGSGKVHVATFEGEARFESQGKQVLVGKGNESTAFPGAAPSDPERIPEEIILSVIWPDDDKAESVSKIRGRVSPSSRVRVNGKEIPVESNGSFQTSVRVAETPTPVQLDVEDILGRQTAVDKVLRRPPRAPWLQTKDEWLWKK
jgi:FecR protein